ncbi:MAG: O-antigen ligase family protein [Deltaproteobacteria bacterium]|nr:O-antigen ligase family protein [Deltaproteobacteria bacterium]
MILNNVGCVGCDCRDKACLVSLNQKRHQGNARDKACLVSTDIFRPENRLYLLLLLITFSIVILVKNNIFINAQIIFWHEMTFILFYIFLKRKIPTFPKDMSIFLPILLWYILITISFLNSPYDLINKNLALHRYAETIAHIVFFFFIREELTNTELPLYPILIAIPLSTLYVEIIFVLFYLLSPENISSVWLGYPPLNSNIRHTGMQIMAGLSVLLAAAIPFASAKKKSLLLVLTTSLLWAFLFWTGGRGAILSTFICSIFILIISFKYYPDFISTFKIISVSMITGFFLGEFFSCFEWNGLLHSISRSINATTIDKLSAGRIEIWKTALVTIKSHLLLGVGPQGYIFMPNNIYPNHPHNLFLQFLLEWGIVGTILFIYIFIWIIIKGLIQFRIAKGHTIYFEKLISIAIIITLTLNGLTGGTYYLPQPSYYLVLSFAIWLLPARSKVGRF